MEKILPLLNELIVQQKKTLLSLAQRIAPHVVEDDLLQPNDFPELEHHPAFRYEEGVLHGLESFKMALLALQKQA